MFFLVRDIAVDDVGLVYRGRFTTFLVRAQLLACPEAANRRV